MANHLCSLSVSSSGALVARRSALAGQEGNATQVSASVRRLLHDFETGRIRADVLEVPGLSNFQRDYIHNVAAAYKLKTKSRGLSHERVLMVRRAHGEAGKAHFKAAPVEPLRSSRNKSAQDSIVAPRRRDVLERFRGAAPPSHRGGFDALSAQPTPLMDPAGLKLSSRQVERINAFRCTFPETESERRRFAAQPINIHVTRNEEERLPMYAPVKPPKAKPPNRKLPAYKIKKKIVDAIGNHQVTIITGETGCGKTTQVPQYLLEEAREAGKAVSVVVTQPRRLPATAVAKRVAQERGEKLGATVGYHIRFDRCSGSKTALLFCTSGVLLKTLMDGDERLKNLSHIILDEVHEREQFTDFLLTHLKLSLARFPSLKLILMSATMSEHVDLFKAYFSEFKVAVCHIPCQTFEVSEVYLEDIFLLGTGYDSALVANATAKATALATLSSDTATSSDDEEEEHWDEGPVSQDVEVSRRVDDEDDAVLPGLVKRRIDGEKQFVTAAMARAIDAVRITLRECGGEDKSPDCILLEEECVPVEPVSMRLRPQTTTTAVDLSPPESTCGDVTDSEAAQNARLEELKTQQLLHLYAKKRRKNERVDVDLLVCLVRFLIPKAVGHGSILVFLPGMEDMSLVRDRLESDNFGAQHHLLILTLHSQVHDDAVAGQLFSPAPSNAVKVILSTNIAEASITIEDVVMVVDSGKAKEKNYHAATESTSLVEKWVSKSSATQRKGRAGRCRDGVVYRLYSRQQFAHMKETGVPEILRVPIFEACLKARQMIPPEMRIADFLGAAPEPPTEASLTDAVNFLKTLEALDEKESMTELGRFLAEVSLGPKLAISLLNAIVLRCLDPVLSIVVAVSSRDPFMVSFGEDRNRFKKERAETSRGFYSDHYALFRVVFLYAKEAAKGFGAKKRFCVENGLNFQAMEMIINAKRQLMRDLERLGLVNETKRGLRQHHLNRNSNSWPMVKAAIAAGAYPFFALVDHGYEPSRIRTRFEDKAKLFSKSTLAEQLPPVASSNVFLAYEDVTKRSFGGTYLGTLTGLSSLTVAIFAGPARVPNSSRLTVEEMLPPRGLYKTPLRFLVQTWDLGQIRVSAPLKDAELAWFLRRKWKAALLRKLANWTAAPTPEEDELVQVLATVLQQDDVQAKLQSPPEFTDFTQKAGKDVGLCIVTQEG